MAGAEEAASTPSLRFAEWAAIAREAARPEQLGTGTRAADLVLAARRRRSGRRHVRVTNPPPRHGDSRS